MSAYSLVIINEEGTEYELVMETVATVPSHTILAGRDAANQHPASAINFTDAESLQAKFDAGAFLTTNQKNILIAANTHIDDVAEKKHAAVQIQDASAHTNLETNADATQAVINAAINARLYEQIGIVLSGYDIDATDGADEMPMPYPFIALRLAASTDGSQTGSTLIVTFYKNAVSIGGVTVLESEKYGYVNLEESVSFAEGDIFFAEVTQEGLDAPGKTVKAFIKGIKS